MSRIDLLAIIAGCVALVAVVLGPVAIVSHNSTERTKACIEAGGSYLHVPEVTTMECYAAGERP